MKQKRRRFEKSLSSIWSSARSGFSKTSWLVAGSYPSCEYQGAASALVDRRFFAVLYTPFFRTQSTSARFVTRNCAILVCTNPCPVAKKTFDLETNAPLRALAAQGVAQR